MYTELSLAPSKCSIKGSCCHTETSSRLAQELRNRIGSHPVTHVGFSRAVSQASDPSRCDAPHRTPPATLSSFQVPQGTQHSSLFAFCTFCSPGSNALFLTPRYPSVSALTSLSQVRLTLCRTEPHGFFQENMTHPHWYLFSICPPCWAGGTDVLCLLGRRNPAQGLGRSRCSNIC